MVRRSTIVLITLFLLLPLQAGAQPVRDYTLYHETILRIEEATSQERFGESVRLYAELFHRYDRAFARDAYDACQLAALTGSIYFNTLFSRCALVGVPLPLLVENRHIAPLYARDSHRLHMVYDMWRTAYQIRIDTALRREMVERFELEQRARGGANYRAICADNFTRIVQLAAGGRFPGEGLIGPDDELGNGYTFTTLLHYPYSYTALDSVLWNAVRQGNAQPSIVLYLYGFNQTRTSILYDGSIPVDSVNFGVCYNLPFGRRSADIDEVNRNRKARWVVPTDVEGEADVRCGEVSARLPTGPVEPLRQHLSSPGLPVRDAGRWCWFGVPSRWFGVGPRTRSVRGPTPDQQHQKGHCRLSHGPAPQNFSRATIVATHQNILHHQFSNTMHTHHAIDYIEISVTDMEAARRFYTAAFGWGFTDYGPGYAGIQGVEREQGGLRLEDEVRGGGPLVILYSDDLDATLAAVRSAGGEISEEPFDFPGGRRFHFRDPSGNEMAVWSEK